MNVSKLIAEELGIYILYDIYINIYFFFVVQTGHFNVICIKLLKHIFIHLNFSSKIDVVLNMQI